MIARVIVAGGGGRVGCGDGQRGDIGLLLLLLRACGRCIPIETCSVEECTEKQQTKREWEITAVATAPVNRGEWASGSSVD